MMPGPEIFAQTGLLPERTAAVLSDWFGEMQELPASPTDADLRNLVNRLGQGKPEDFKPLVIVDPATAGRLSGILSEVDPEWRIRVVVAAIPPDTFSSAPPEALANYLLELLGRIDRLPGRQMERLEEYFDLKAQKTVFFLSSSA